MSKANRRHGASQRALSSVPQLPIRPVLGRQSPKPSIWTWTPSNTYAELAFPQLSAIMRAAEQGMIEQWADLTCRMRASDDHLYSVLETRISGVAGADWSLSPGEGGDPELAKRAAEDCERMLRSLPSLSRVFRDVLDGVPVGWSVNEIVWEPNGSEWAPKEIIWLHPRRFRFAEDFSMFLWDDGRAAAEAERVGAPLTTSKGANGMALSPNKYIVHIPRVIQNYPQSSGLLMACVRPWFVKQWVTKFWLSGAEIAGNPRYIATVPQAADSALFEDLLSQLGTLASDGVMAFREGVSVNVQAPLAQGSGSIWQALYDNANAAISKAVLGSTLNVEIGDTGGAYSAAESQSDITITPRIMSDAAAMWDTIGRDLLRPYLFFNRHKYGGIVPPIPSGKTILFEPKIEVDELLVRTGSVTKNELRQSRGLDPLPQGGDTMLQSETPQSSFAQPGAVGPTAEVEKAADTALNGAQVSSMLDIVERVSLGLIPRDTGIALIVAAFPLTREQAENILGTVGAGFVPSTQTQPAEPSVEADAALPLQQAPWEVALRIATSTTSKR